MNLKERSLFFGDALKNLHEVGSVIPSSQAVARAMTAAMRQRPAPRNILEVGAGTGPITARIVRQMQPGDHLDVYEINPRFTTYLQRRFEREPRFQRVQGQVEIYTAGVETIEPVPQYDIIISAIPFTNFQPEMVEMFLETYRTILKPGGVLTYIEFALGKAILSRLSKRPDRERIRAVAGVLKRYQDAYQFRHRFVPLNAPPARIRSLRFD